MRRRRRRTGTWLPTFGFEVGQETDTKFVTGLESSIDVPDNGDMLTHIHDVTVDEPTEDLTDQNLSRVIGSEYFLNRIVGKLFAQFRPEVNSPALSAALFGAGFFVARADRVPVDPIGAGATTEDSAERAADYSPLDLRAIREPWIWRRTWILGGGQATTVDNLTPPWFPPTTAHYGSIQDGPHIDAKTKRRISNDDRLWFAVSAVRWPLLSAEEEPQQLANIDFHLDYRLFGSLRKAHNRGVF